MDPTQQNTGNPLSNILNSVGTGLTKFAASQGNEYAQGSLADAAVSQGMKQLSGIMDTMQGDPQAPQRAMLKFVQTPEGQQVMKTPGAFKQLIETFQKAVIPAPPTSMASGPGTTTTQQGQPYSQGGSNTVPAYPQQTQVPAGQTNITTQPGNQNTSTMSQPTLDSQHLNYVLKNFGGGLTQDGLNTLAQATLATTPFAQQSLAINGLVSSKQITPEEGKLALSGTVSIQPDKEIPGRFYLINNATHEIQMKQLGGLGSGDNKSLNPTWTAGPGANPSSMSSSPANPNTNNVPAMKPQANATDPQVQATAKKYGAPVEAIKQDGTIDPIAAYGPSSIIALGAGFPAIAQNKSGVVAQWFAPTQYQQGTEMIAKAEMAGDALRYLSTALAPGNTRIKAMIDAVLEMNPEHEEMNSPLYATDQLIQLRSTLEGQATANQTELTNNMQEGMKADNKLIQDARAENARIEQVLQFLPSTDALSNMKEAIKDGKIDVPSMASAAASTGKTIGSAIGQGAKVLFGGGTADKYNDNAADTISKINNVQSAKELGKLPRMYQQLTPAIQRALDAKIEALRSGGGGKATPYSDNTGRPQGPSVKQFTKNPAGEQTVNLKNGKQAVLPPANGQESAMYNAAPTSKQPVFGPNARRVNNAFSDLGQ